MELTEEELKKIEDRCSSARSAPWTSFIEGRDHSSGSSFIQIGSDAQRDQDIELSGATDADQDFIAHARSDIPRLIAEIRRLKKKLSSL